MNRNKNIVYFLLCISFCLSLLSHDDGSMQLNNVSKNQSDTTFMQADYASDTTNNINYTGFSQVKKSVDDDFLKKSSEANSLQFSVDTTKFGQKTIDGPSL